MVSNQLELSAIQVGMEALYTPDDREGFLINLGIALLCFCELPGGKRYGPFLTRWVLRSLGNPRELPEGRIYLV